MKAYEYNHGVLLSVFANEVRQSRTIFLTELDLYLFDSFEKTAFVHLFSKMAKVQILQVDFKYMFVICTMGLLLQDPAQTPNHSNDYLPNNKVHTESAQDIYTIKYVHSH